MPKNVIIFGAGASYGSENHKDLAPPLANNLFNKLLAYDPSSWKPLEQNFGTLFLEDFEKGMKAVADNEETYLPVMQRSLASYFFQFKPSSNNLYRKLVKQLDANWDGLFVTLNYERLLELSLISLGIKPVCGGQRTNKNQIELCLPHGYCNIFCIGLSMTGGISYTKGIKYDGPIKVIPNEIEFNKMIRENAIPPVMSYFDETKYTVSGISFIQEQRARYEKAISEAKAISIVGMNVREHDLHIWNPLSKTKAEILYCSGETGGNIYKGWAERNRPNKHDLIVPKYFEEALDEIYHHASG